MNGGEKTNKKLLIIPITIFLLFTISLANADTQILLSGLNDNTDNGQHIVCGQIISGQAFTLTQTSTINSVSVKIYREKSKPTGTLDFSIVQLGQYAVPEETILTSGSLSADKVPTTTSWITITLTPTTLPAGRYALLLKCPALRYPWGNKMLLWRDSYKPELSGGLSQALYSADGGLTWSCWSTVVMQYEIWGASA